jgi:hypothetical protein
MQEALNELLENVSIGKKTVFNVLEEVGVGKALIVEQRALLPEAPRAPDRAESPKKAHVFFDSAGFGAYLSKYGSADTVVFADPIEGVCSAVMDEKAKAGFEIVTMQPQLHPLWKPWEKCILAGRLSLESFVEFIGAHRRSIVLPDSRELIMALSQIKATTTVELHRGRGKEALNGLLVKTRIQGQEKESIVELPEMVRVRAPIFIGTTPKEIEVDVLIEVAGDDHNDLEVALSTGDMVNARMEAFDEMLKALDGVKSKGATVTFGKPQHASWNYLK